MKSHGWALKYMWLNERNQSEETAYCVIVYMWHSRMSKYSRRGKNMETIRRSVVAIVTGVEEVDRKYTQNFQGIWSILYSTVIVDTCNYTFAKTEYTTAKSDTLANYRLWVIMMCPWNVIGCNKLQVIVQYIDIRSCVWGRVGNVWELFVLSVQFYCDHKTDLKSILKIQTTTANIYDNNFEDSGHQVTEKSDSLQLETN